jgi:hypothetical protein
MLASLGVITVSASGNDYHGKEGVGYPSADKYSYSIGAVSHTDQDSSWNKGSDTIVKFSDRDGELTSVFAPGVTIPAAKMGGGVVKLSGTSMASPVVAGAVAVIQQLSEALIGKKLSFVEMETLFKQFGDIIFDGDDEDTSVTPTELNYPRLNIYNSAKAILELSAPGQYLVQVYDGSEYEEADFGIVSSSSLSAVSGSFSTSADSTDTITGGTIYNDIITGSSGSDKILGGSGMDVLYGEDGSDVLIGGEGKDYLEGGPGQDTLTGGTGRDTFVINSLDEVGDTITDFDITVPSGETEPASSSSVGFVLIVDSSPQYLNLNLAGYENIMGSNGDDILVGSAGDNILDGGAGADIIFSGYGTDTFVLRIGSGGKAITDADTFKDFTDGTDLIGLDNGLTFSDLTIEQGTGSYSNHTVIKIGSEYLAVVENMIASDLMESSFTPINIDESDHISAPFFFGTNEDGDSLDIDLSNMSNQNPNDSNLGLKDLNPEQLPIIEENNKIEFNLEEDLSEILLEVKDTEPVSETTDNDIGYVIDSVYEEDELLFAGLEI